ncbi:Flagellar motor rotation protein MotB [hydrothermal vent metagenome]|uniref:Flagellar motor rotation protein MotB n=1 Tax=hydrothermal vent metagenome TaxID=652676 RepID=A0A3B1BP70_9ZZZZ
MAENTPSKAKVVAIPCPSCKVKAKVPVDRITAKGLIYTCPSCKTKIRAVKDGNKVSIRRASAAEIAVEEVEVEEEAPEDKIVTLAPDWIVTFADLATLLLTFFVLMLSFANVDVVKFKELAGSVADRYGVTMEERGSYQAVSSGSMADVDSNLKETTAVVRRERLVNTIYDTIIREGFRGSTSITSTDEGVRVRVRGRALFEPGKSILRPESLKLLEGLVNLLNQTKDLILVIEGHTDSSRIRTKKFPSNWELSVIRASTALEYIISKGAPAKRLSAVGYADTKPLFPQDKPETRLLNRRIEFLFKRL